MQRIGRRGTLAAVALIVVVAGACGDDDDDDSAADEPVTETTAADAEPESGEDRPAIEITAEDYSFGPLLSFAGGLVDLSLVNKGKEPHFAAFAQPKDGVTLEAVRAALSTPPAQAPPGPPPFVEFAALGTVGPGGESRMTMDLPPGRYVLFCALPAADGVPHLAKGMMSDIEVAAGAPGDLPETDVTVTAADFAFGGATGFKAGTNSVTLENKGKQIHEVDLVELAEGKTIEDAKAWAKTLQGPPPMKFHGGPAVRDGLSVTTTFELEPGVNYAFVCIIPDSLSDFAAHITKGMYTPVFQVDP